jgi:hypothetical protein
MRILAAIFVLVWAGQSHATCLLTLPRAGFADAIVDREPVGDGNQPLERLWFFTEVADGAGEVLYHQWYRNGEEDVRIRLPVGADRWRTWSGRQPQPEYRYTVRVLTESGCDLGEYGLSSVTDAQPDVLTSARAALEQGDITGARLLARGAQESGNRHPALALFINEELALAELARDIDTDNLYVASGRIESLGKRTLPAPHQRSLGALQERWQARRDELTHDMRQRLMALQRTLAALPSTASCAAPIENMDWLPEPERGQLILTDQQHHDTTQTLILMDQRTGERHTLERPCL